jgi:prophage regulatory protein
MTAHNDDPIEVRVPPANVGLNAAQRALWDAIKAAVARARPDLTRDELLTVLVSGISRELRRELGPDGAATVLRGFADTQREAVKFDSAGLLRGGEIWSSPDRPGRLPISRQTWLTGVRDGHFPKPIRLGPGVVAWRAEDIARLEREGTGRGGKT